MLSCCVCSISCFTRGITSSTLHPILSLLFPILALPFALPSSPLLSFCFNFIIFAFFLIFFISFIFSIHLHHVSFPCLMPSLFLGLLYSVSVLFFYLVAVLVTCCFLSYFLSVLLVVQA
ncbi:hypothetical protein M758_UG334800 [Ceratodon purpureus]|nr:hypothetical protein M758_UG334800 [Ceratodon purpureus]